MYVPDSKLATIPLINAKDYLTWYSHIYRSQINPQTSSQSGLQAFAKLLFSLGLMKFYKKD